MARKYTKKSNYWKKFEGREPLSNLNEAEASYEPNFAGEAFYTSDASYKSVSSAKRSNTIGTSNTSRINGAAVKTTVDRFSSIRKGMLPYEYASDGVTCERRYRTMPKSLC